MTTNAVSPIPAPPSTTPVVTPAVATPHPSIYRTATSFPRDVAAGRGRLERQVQVARREATAWATDPLNGERLGAYLTSYGSAVTTSPRGRSHLLAACTVLLTEWDVPGVRPPDDLASDLAGRWVRSVTLAVLRGLRRTGYLS